MDSEADELLSFLETVFNCGPEEWLPQQGAPPECEPMIDAFCNPEEDLSFFEELADNLRALPDESSGSERQSSFKLSPIEPLPAGGADNSPLLPLSLEQTDRPKQRGGKPSTAPAATTLAQRRYYRKQKARRQGMETQLAKISKGLEELQSEKQQLVLEQRALVSRLQDSQTHLEELFGNEAVNVEQQTALLRFTASILSRAEGRAIPLEEAKNWTVEEYIAVHFKALIERKKMLSQVAVNDTSSAEYAELAVLESALQSIDGICGGMNSLLPLGLCTFNVQETLRLQQTITYPNWEAIVDGMRLTKEQGDAIVDCWQKLHNTITSLAQQREDIIKQLVAESGSRPMEQMITCASTSLLKDSLRNEQMSSLGFILYVERTLNPAQAAYLDSLSYPWCPEWPKIAKVLFRQRGLVVPETPQIYRLGRSLPVMPWITAFEALSVPITAFGMGVRMRRAVILCPFETIVPAACFPGFPRERVKTTTMLDLMLGKWRQMRIWDWMHKVKELGVIIPNPVV